MMFGEELILRTKLQAPRLRRWTLARPRLLSILERAADYRLTILDAPTGYGKSTLLACWLTGSKRPYAWYNLGQHDTDPFVFLLHLIHSFQQGNSYQPSAISRQLEINSNSALDTQHSALSSALSTQSSTLLTGNRALEILEREWKEARNSSERQVAARPALHLFINELCNNLHEDTFLILDDFHLLESQPSLLAFAEELIANAPQNLHIIISTRRPPVLEPLPRWQVQQEILNIGKESLAFTPAETSQLFEECYGLSLNESQAARLSTETEGWVIALQMIWQNLQTSEQPLVAELANILKDLPQNLTGLFDYLAQEVLSRQELDTQRFLLDSSVLRRMSGPICDEVLEHLPGECEKLLRQLGEAGLFIITQGHGPNRSYRYHHLFGEFLYSRLQTDIRHTRNLHHKAATYYQLQNQLEEALHHYLAAQEWGKAANLLESGLGVNLIDSGRLERLEQGLSTFPPDFLSQRPGLLLLKGDYLRLTSRFEEALQNYRQAIEDYEDRGWRSEVGELSSVPPSLLGKGARGLGQSPIPHHEGLAKALRGRALVYLDTVQPAAAEEWLERALETAEKTSDIQLQATLLRDLAENKLNRGRPLEAEELHRQARLLLGEAEDDKPADVRILLRSGRINEASEYLQQVISEENHNQTSDKNSQRTPRRAGRSHREDLLVLSLLDAIQGAGELAVLRAEQGIFLARELHAPFTEAVAWQRLGHALNVSGQHQRALESYQKGQALGDKLQVRRLRAEGFMGQCLLFGRYPDGNLAEAKRAGEEGLQVARRAGDEWIEGFIQLSLAAALVEHGENTEAIGVIQTARAVLENCGDRFGLMLTRLWAALASGNPSELREVCRECERNGYAFLLEKPTLFGPKNPQTLKLLAELKGTSYKVLPIPTPTPTVPLLRINTLGTFRVSRPDSTEIGPRDWQREKARQLFQLLLTHRDKPLAKEQIVDYLWSESEAQAADSSFKVALNALVRALEPERSSRAQSSYIIRSGSGTSLAYALSIEPEQVWLDAAEFEQLAVQGARAELAGDEKIALDFYNQALKLYQGDFLPGCLYEDWAAAERERLLALFLTTAERLTRLLAARAEWEQCLVVCRLILARDNCWEEAYRLMMLALWKQGNRAAAIRTYEKCSTILAEELGIEPMPQTLKLYNAIVME